jgi:hypothetical protein
MWKAGVGWAPGEFFCDASVVFIVLCAVMAGQASFCVGLRSAGGGWVSRVCVRPAARETGGL